MYPFNRFLQREGNPTSKNWHERKSRSWTRCVFHIPLSVFIGFTVCFTVRFLHSLNHFLCDDLFCFCKPILSRSVNKYCWFWLRLYVAPFFMLLLDISCVLLSYVTSYNIWDTWIMKKWDNLMWSHIMFAWRLLDATFFHSFPPVTCYSSYVARGDI